MLNINRDDIPAVANLNPNVIKHWPINPILDIIISMINEFEDNMGKDNVFGINKIIEDKT